MASFVGVLIFVLILSPVLIPLLITGVHAVAGHGNRKPPPRSVTGRSSAAVKVTGES
jgi:ABC-type transport system involved in cytochrome c biogenesis permease component